MKIDIIKVNGYYKVKFNGVLWESRSFKSQDEAHIAAQDMASFGSVTLAIGAL
jgi:hypothetical protein